MCGGNDNKVLVLSASTILIKIATPFITVTAGYTLLFLFLVWQNHILPLFFCVVDFIKECHNGGRLNVNDYRFSKYRP